MLEIKNLQKVYGIPGVSAKPALNGVDLSVGQGELVGLFGENGAGKTTLLKCVLGLLGYAGTITLDGEPVTRANIARLSFATCEHSFFPHLTPAGHRDFYREHFPRWREKRFQALMDFFQLPMGKAPRSFSTGQKNQFEVVLSLSQGADYILMDEPFAGNDLFNREDFYKVLLGILEPEDPYFQIKKKKLDQGELPYRINHVSWWQQELPSQEEMEEGRRNLAAYGNAVDFIVTHCCASSTQILLGGAGYRPDIETAYLEEILRNTRFRKWFFGHYHGNRNVNAREILIYEQMIRIS